MKPERGQLPNSQAAWIYTSYTRGRGQHAVHLRGWAKYECIPTGPLSWLFGITCDISAPEATFDRELPTMMKIAGSWKVNDRAVQGNASQMIAEMNRNFEATQKAIRGVGEAFDRKLQSDRANERIRDRSHANWSEMMRGNRTVEDTATRGRTDVPLSESGRIVDKANESAGYKRYREVPLRDQ